MITLPVRIEARLDSVDIKLIVAGESCRYCCELVDCQVDNVDITNVNRILTVMANESNGDGGVLAKVSIDIHKDGGGYPRSWIPV